MTLVIYFIYLFIFKIFIIRLMNFFIKKLNIIHIFSTLIPILFFVILNLLFLSLNIYDLILIILTFLVYSYIFITIPGGFASSVRLSLLSFFIKKNKITTSFFRNKFNDKKLFDNRFKRLKNFNIIKKSGKFYYINSKIILTLNKFVLFNRYIYNLIKKN